MPTVKFLPTGKIVEMTSGTTLLDAAQLANIEFVTACGGMGTCGKCKVRVISGEVDPGTAAALDKTEIEAGYVLACRAKILKTPLIIEIPLQETLQGGKFSELEDETGLNQQRFLPPNWLNTSLVSRHLIQVAPAQLEDGLSVMDRLKKAIYEKLGKKEIIYSLRIIRCVADRLHQSKGKISAIIGQIGEKLILIDILTEFESHIYSLAIDIGTTSVAVQIIRLSDAQIIATHSDYNEQIRCGQDVISRINFAGRPEGIKELQTRILYTINRLIRSLCEHHQISANSIYATAISGNTTMIHLFLGLNPEYIRLDPYTPTLLQVPHYPAADLGIEIHPDALNYFSPAVGSYVGGDITAGLLCTDLDASESLSLFIDIGTNGELVVGNKDFLMTCACSAGPAFEGAGLEWGMRAVKGAIDSVTVDPVSGKIEPRIIGDVAPKGICGSGIITLLARLFLTGWIDAAGKVNRVRSSPFIKITGRIAHYIVVPAEETASGKAITLSEAEIANILRAKAAIFSAIALILQKVDLHFADLHKIYIGGNFGRYLDLECAIILGILPDLPLERFHYLGNSSLIGSYMLLVSHETRMRQATLASRMTYLELNTEQAYMDQYTAALFIPHTDNKLFPSVMNRMQSSNASRR